jgi:poly(A) polymerase
MEKISPERIRDEFFRLLDGPNQSAGILSLQLLGLGPYVIPGELSSFQTRVIRNLEDIWSLFLIDHDQERVASWAKGLLVHRLGRYRENLREYVGQEFVPGRTFYQLSFALALVSGLSQNGTNLPSQEVFAKLPLSNQELSFLEKGIKATQSWLNLVEEDGKNQPVEVYCYFNRYGLSGIAGIFLALGELVDDWQGENGQDRWIEQLDLARFFLEGYWERHQEWVDPPVLLDGNQIQKEFQLSPGPKIGYLIEILREEQVRSGINSREEGLKFLEDHSQLTDGMDQ